MNNYDELLNYDSKYNFDALKSYAKTKTDIFVTRGSDNLFEFTIADAENNPVAISGFSIEGKILEYYNTSKIYPATYAITDSVSAKFSIDIEDTTLLVKPSYVYEVYLVSGADKIRIQYGQLFVE